LKNERDSLTNWSSLTNGIHPSQKSVELGRLEGERPLLTLCELCEGGSLLCKGGPPNDILGLAGVPEGLQVGFHPMQIMGTLEYVLFDGHL